MVPESWQEAVFRLALSPVEEEADQGRTSCASLRGLGAPFRGAPNPREHNPTAFIRHESECIQLQMRFLKCIKGAQGFSKQKPACFRL